MKSKFVLILSMVVFAVLLSGCGNHASESRVPSSGQTFNAVQYLQDFESASPEVKGVANQAWMAIQSGAFPKAQKELSQLAANPALNDAQKKSVADLTAQLKKQIELRATP